MSAIDVSVIIVNYNTKALTKACIDSVFFKTKGVSFEVILVDNASNDGSKEYFACDQRINYIYHHSNVGFGRANNLGYQYAKGDYIFFLNSDTLLMNNAIYELFHYLDATDTSIGCIGCVLTDRYGHITHSYGDFPTIKSYCLRLLAYYHIRLKAYSDMPKEGDVYPLNVDYVTGADMFVKRHVLEECGLFDPDFFMYFEETDLQYRFRQHGYISQIIISPAIKHLQGASNRPTKKGKSLKMAQIELKSRLLYAKKHFNRFESLCVSLLHLLMIPKIILYNANYSEKKKLILTILLSI